MPDIDIPESGPSNLFRTPLFRTPSVRSTFGCGLLALLALTQTCLPQALPTASFAADSTSSAAAASNNGEGPAGIIPYTRGFNASLGSTTQHDSSNGWSSILTPGVAYRFNSVFSIDASIPVYAYINIDANRGTRKKPIYQLVTRRDVPGDTSLAAHAAAHRLVDYNATVSLGLPTGNTAYGLGAGQTTYSFNNHLEKSLGLFSPDLEFGIADTSSLNNRRVRRSYTSVGLIAHLQAGTSLDLTRRLSFSVDAYEDLPLVRGIVYSTTGRGRKQVTTAAATASPEDNGVNTSLDLPVSAHVTVSGIYSHSLRAHDDVAGISLTFLLRAPPHRDDLSH